MREPRPTSTGPTAGPRATDRRRTVIDRPTHPTGAAVLLLVGVTVLVVALAALSAWGLI